MSIRRFHVEDVSPSVIRVDGPEADHALRVLRLGIGGSVVLFDGRGGQANGRIVAVGRGRFDVEVTERTDRRLEGSTGLTIATALPKGDRADWLVEKCAELGVANLVPLECERAAVRPGETKLERLRRKAVAAAKQAGRATIMAIQPLTDLSEFLARREDPFAFGDPEKANPTLSDWLTSNRSAASVTIVIGPEGGFTAAERRAIEEAGGRAVRFAGDILRIETACVAVAAVWAEWSLSSRAN